MKRLLILSGKGGTGKTTTAAAFIRFADAKAVADYDVDAPNLHIIMNRQEEPEIKDFIGSDKAFIDPSVCTGCGRCLKNCRFDAIRMKDGKCSVLDYACEGCGVCEYVCPAKAVSMKEDVAGKQLLYKNDDSVFSTAKLRMGRGNSGKLVTAVKIAMLENAPETDIAVSDGSPGIGCPVIASVSGTDLVLIVAEPSLSGISDLKRLIKTADTFRCKLAVCVNKYDQSEENTKAIEDFCKENEIPFAGKIPYDKTASKAINEGRSIADIPCRARDALYEVYKKTMEVLG